MSKFLLFISVMLVGGYGWAQAESFTPPQSMDAPSAPITILESEMDTKPDNAFETAPVSQVASAEKALGEDQIPVLQKKSEAVEAAPVTSPFRVIAAITVIALMVFGLALSTKKWLQKNAVPNKHTNIRVVTQHYLGAKKNLAIISVAGEYILIGVTDHNINLIKTLSLMDDEIPEETSQPFQKALKNAEARPNFVESNAPSQPPPLPTELTEDEGFSIRSIKDVVRTKLKGMKEIS